MKWLQNRSLSKRSDRTLYNFNVNFRFSLSTKAQLQFCSIRKHRRNNTREKKTQLVHKLIAYFNSLKSLNRNELIKDKKRLFNSWKMPMLLQTLLLQLLINERHFFKFNMTLTLLNMTRHCSWATHDIKITFHYYVIRMKFMG